METLFVHFLLWRVGFESSEKYNEILDKMFLENPKSAFLLDLEECSSNSDAAYQNIHHFFAYQCNPLDVVKFGKELFCGLKSVYTDNSLPIKEFGEKCYNLWNALPGQVREIEPFFTLCYADDCLSYGDEAETRYLYEKAFAFYDEVSVCENCQDLVLRKSFYSKQDWLNCLEYIKELIVSESYELVESTCDFNNIRNADGEWSKDEFRHVIKCKCCGKRYLCCANTYRGGGGFIEEE